MMANNFIILVEWLRNDIKDYSNQISQKKKKNTINNYIKMIK